MGSVPPDTFVKAGDVSLHCLDWGGDGPLMLMVPGVTGTAHIYDGIAAEFTDRYRVVAMTRRGHGLSAMTEAALDLDTCPRDLAALIDHFTEAPAVVVGHSHAGVELPRLAQRYPSKVRGLVLLDAVYDWPGLLEWPPQPGFPGPERVYATWEEAEGWFRDSMPELWSDVARRHVRSQAYEGDQGIEWHVPWTGERLKRFVKLWADWSASEYAGIRAPVFSAQADQEAFAESNLRARGFPADEIEASAAWCRDYDNPSKAAGAAMLLEAVPHAVNIVLSETHHILMLQRPEEIARRVGAFLATQRGGRSNESGSGRPSPPGPGTGFP